jgi:hypothetical protein
MNKRYKPTGGNMPPRKFSITAVLEYDAALLEAFIQMIENVIDFITKEENVRFFLKIIFHQRIRADADQQYQSYGCQGVQDREF